MYAPRKGIVSMLQAPGRVATTNIMTDLVMTALNDEVQEKEATVEDCEDYTKPKSHRTSSIRKQSRNVLVVILIFAVFESSLYLFSGTATNIIGSNDNDEGMIPVSVVMDNVNECGNYVVINLTNITKQRYELKKQRRDTQTVPVYNNTQYCDLIYIINTAIYA